MYRDSESKLALYDLHARRTQHLPVQIPQQQGSASFSWSSDGCRLAFNRQTQDGEQLEVFVLKTMRERVIVRLHGSVRPIGWSADSSRIAVAIEHGTNVDIAWVSVERGSVRLITTVDNAFQNGRSFSAVLSPDSRQIAFTRIREGRSRDIFTISEDGTQEVVVEHPADDYPVGYTNDMRRLLFASDRSGSIDLWSTPVPADKSRPSLPARIRRNLGVVKSIGITNDQTLYYVLSQCSADVFTVGFNSTYDATLASRKAIATRFVGYNSAPDWSPSGEEIVYQVGQPGSPDGIDLVFLSLRTGAERLVHPTLLQFSRPRYAADGKSVAVHGMGIDGVQGIYQIDAQTGAPLLLARGGGGELANPVWTARGEILFFERGGNSVWMMDRDSQKQVQLYKSPGRNANFNSAPSSDGKTVAVIDGASLLVMRTGEDSREILHLTPPEMFAPFPGSLAWTADGRYILFGKVAERERQVWRMPAVGGRAEPIGLSVQDDALYFLRTSADSRGIAFVIGDCDLRPQEVWSMDNFF